MGDVIEADLFRQRGQLSRLLAEAMANALKVGLAGGWFSRLFTILLLSTPTGIRVFRYYLINRSLIL